MELKEMVEEDLQLEIEELLELDPNGEFTSFDFYCHGKYTEKIPEDIYGNYSKVFRKINKIEHKLSSLTFLVTPEEQETEKGLMLNFDNNLIIYIKNGIFYINYIKSEEENDEIYLIDIVYPSLENNYNILSQDLKDIVKPESKKHIAPIKQRKPRRTKQLILKK